MTITQWCKLVPGDLIQHRESKYVFEVTESLGKVAMGNLPRFAIIAKPIQYYTMPGTRAIEVDPNMIYNLENYNDYEIYIKPPFNRLDIIE